MNGETFYWLANHMNVWAPLAYVCLVAFIIGIAYFVVGDWMK